MSSKILFAANRPNIFVSSRESNVAVRRVLLFDLRTVVADDNALLLNIKAKHGVARQMRSRILWKT